MDIGGWKWDKWVGGWIAKFVVRNGENSILYVFNEGLTSTLIYEAITIPLQTLVPYAGIPISAMFKAVATARSLHAPVRLRLRSKDTPLIDSCHSTSSPKR